MDIRETRIPGCAELQPKVFRDDRGAFVEAYVEAPFAERGWPVRWAAEFYSVSKKDVLRGMHFQKPPHAQAKWITCVSGEILDVVVDLRKGSPAYGRFETFRLSSARGNAVYLPAGLAHGFLALSDPAIVWYKVSSPYAPASEGGVAWNGFGFAWPIQAPDLSPRDQKWPSLKDFDSPFI